MIKKRFFTAQRMIPFIVSISFFMEALDSTVINTAIPAMARSLQVEALDLKVALISYFLSLAIFIPVSGWLADRFGVRKIFTGAMCIFTLSSLWCGFADNLTSLIIARFFQGLGGALGLPVGRLIIVKTFGRKNLISMMNRVVTIGALGMMLGPVIGGFITHYVSWHWIFWVNIPFGIMAILLARHWLEDGPPQIVPPLDKVGFLLFGAALAGCTFSLSALSETNANNYISIGVLLSSCVLLLAYMLHSRRQLHPVVNTRLLQLRTFQVSVIANLISRVGFGGVPFLVPLLLQIGLGYPAQQSGMLLAPTAFGILTAKYFALPLLRIFGYRRLLILNTFFAVFSIWGFISINASTPIYLIIFLTYFYGATLSVQYSCMNSLAYADISQTDLSSATSIISTLQQLAQSFGVAMAALFIRLFTEIISENSILTPAVFHYTFFAVGFITLLSILAFIRLKSEDGQQMMV